MTDIDQTALRRPRAISGGPLAYARARELAARTIAVASLGGLVACAVEIALGAAAARSWLVPASQARFPAWMSGPLHALSGRTLSEHSFAVLMLVMAALYLIALATARSLSLRIVVAAVAALTVVMALAPPIELTDLFNYLGFARLGVVHHLNPYAHGVIEVRRDPVVPFDTWRYLHSPYGPLFTLATYAVAPLGIAAAVWVMKASAAIFGLGCLALVIWCARRLGRDPVRAAAFVGLNPVMIIWGVGGGHNEFLMLLLALAGIALTLAARERLSMVATVAAAAVKANAAILLPFELAASRRRGRALVAAVAATAVGLGIGVALFGTSLLTGLRTQSQCISKLSVPDAVGRLVGAGGATTGVRAGLLAVLAGVGVWQLTRTRRRQWIAPAGWATLALLGALTWLMPWYVSLVLVLAALSDSRALRIAALVACAYSLAVWLPTVNTKISHALPRAHGTIAGGCTTHGSHNERRHRGWAQGFL